MKCFMLLLCCLPVLATPACAGSKAPAGQNTSAASAGKNGFFSRPDYFPIAVWLQSPENAPKYKAAGINLFVGLWQGPTDAQLAALKQVGMPVICEQNAVGLAHKGDPIIAGWMHGDEPDNAQPAAGGGYGPFIPPAAIVQEYKKMKAADPTRAVMLNLGQGVANDEWVGRGSGAKLSDYETYVLGGDLVSYDVYPVAGLEKPDSENYLWYVAKGLDRLAKWTGGTRLVWNCIECTRISGTRKATPKQVRSEVWMSLIHGSRGLIYFVHQFTPTFDEHALLDDPEMLAEVTAINRQIKELAPVLNSATISGRARVESDSAQTPINLMEKHHGGATYLFTVGMRNSPANGRIVVPGRHGTTEVEVLGENRKLTMQNGTFRDSYAPYAVHLYRFR